MAIAANVHRRVAIGCAREIVRLDDRAASKEREWRREHAPVPQRNETFDAALAVLLEQRNRIAIDVSDGRMAPAGDAIAQGPASGPTFVGRQRCVHGGSGAGRSNVSRRWIHSRWRS